VLFLKSRRKRKITSIDKNARIDEVDALGDKWQYYDIFHPGLKLWMKVTGETDITKSPYYGATAEEIDWLKKIDIQAAAQKWICHSISNTTNLPEDISVDTVEALCMHGWETGCKGITIYRKGSRAAVIVDEPAAKEGDQPLVIVETHAPKRPKNLECDIHRVSIKGEQYLVLVGLLNGRPYEVFAGLSKYVEIPRKVKKATLIKNGKKDGVAMYNLNIPIGDDDNLMIKDVVTVFDNPEHGTLTRLTSMSLRHGVPIQYVVEQLKKDKHSDLFSFSSVVARVLKNYIKDGTKVTIEKTCSECNSTNLAYQQGCVTCLDCGNSKCG
jgi:ribonucleoside-diphosphate reductase alpha chain